MIESLETRCLLSTTPGLPDLTYNTTGVNALSTIPNIYYGTFLGVATQTDGKSVAVGYIQQTNTTTGNDILLARFNTNGTLDTSFGGNNTGYVIKDIGSQNQTSANIKLQADGKILVLTSSGVLVQNLANSWIVRFNANGTLDTAFGGNNTGYVASADTFSSIALQGDGSILAAGSTSTTTVANAFVDKYTAAGALVTGFGTNGRATTQIGPTAASDDAFIYSIVQDSNGNILLGGSRGDLNIPGNPLEDALVIRFTSAGNLDTTFAAGKGFVSANVLNEDFFETIQLLPNNGILLAGNANVANNTRNVAILEFDNTGVLKHTYTPSVYGTTTSGTETNNANAFPLQDGRIVGETGVFGTIADSQSFIYRLTSSGTLDATFGNSGKFDVATNQSAVLINASLQADGALIGVGAQLSPAGGTYYPFIARYNGDAAGTNHGSISGNVFNDANANAAKGGTETNLAGVTVYIDADSSGTLNGTEASTVTDANGNYAFSDLSAGTYAVRVIAPAGYTQTLPAASAAASVVVAASTNAVAGEIGLTNVVISNASIAGVVYSDLDDNGTFGGNDTALSGVTITLTGPGNSTKTTTSNAGGAYSFSGLPAGNYTLSETVPSGYSQTQPAGTYSFQLTTSQAVTGQNFGNFKPVILPTLSVNDVTQNEGNSGTTNFVFTVTRSGDLTGTSSVNYSTSNGTATAGSDYTSVTNGSVQFAAGQATQTFAISVVGDTAVESDETFNVTLAGAVGATISDGTGVGTITNDDVAVTGPTVSISDVSMNEGNTGTTAFVFTVTRGGTSTAPFTVDYGTADGSATVADGDYQAASGTLTFNAGDTTKTITVLVNGDSKVEPNEAFTVVLSNFALVQQPAIQPASAVAPAAVASPITKAIGTGTIVNDDAVVVLPTLAIDNVSHNEGNANTTAYVFTVTRTGDTSGASSVAYATANGTATEPGDYSAASGTVSFIAGQKTATITVNVNGDTTVEGNETFTVNLSSPTNATIATATGTGTIVNDDTAVAAPTVSINDLSLNEGNAGTTAFVFTVTRSGDASVPFTVDYATADGTATVADGDYQAAAGTLTFNAGDTTKTITVLVNGDTKVEANEAFTVNLSNFTTIVNGIQPAIAANPITKATGTGTIVNDDTAVVPPTLSINDVSKSEGNSGQTAFTFTVTRSGDLSGASSVQYLTADSTALAGSDYTGTSGTLNFIAGQKTASITVLVNGDTAVEADEQFTVKLTNATGATVSDTQGIGTIKNDDQVIPPTKTKSQPYIIIDNPRVKEGNHGLTAMTFTLTLTHTSHRTVTVHFKTTDGVLGDSKHDYIAKSGTVTFKPGQRTATVTIYIRANTFKESNEKFYLDLFNSTNAGIGDHRGTGTIVNDD